MTLPLLLPPQQPSRDQRAGIAHPDDEEQIPDMERSSDVRYLQYEVKADRNVEQSELIMFHRDQNCSAVVILTRRGRRLEVGQMRNQPQDDAGQHQLQGKRVRGQDGDEDGEEAEEVKHTSEQRWTVVR